MKSQTRRTFLRMGMLGLGVGMLSVAMPGRADTVRTDVELSTKDVSSKEVVAGDVVADALKAAAKSDIALIAASFFSDTAVTIPKGSFDTAALLRGLEYQDNKIVVSKLTGDQLKRALQHAFYLYPKANSSYLQFSGLTVTVNPDSETRVVSIKVGSDPLDPAKTYKVAMPASLAKGALSYFKFWQKSDIDHETDKTLKDAVSDYLSSKKTITKGDDRLVVKGK